MGNCMRCRGKAKNNDGDESYKPTDKPVDKKKKKKNNNKEFNDVPPEERSKLKIIKPLEEDKNATHRTHLAGTNQEQQVIRLVLPYIPKKDWGRLRVVCKSWCQVIDDAWARQNEVQLTELLPTEEKNRDKRNKKYRLVADHIATNCRHCNGIRLIPNQRSRGDSAIDLSDDGFWRKLAPKAADLQTLRLHSVDLPKYFFFEFLPLCKNLRVLEITQDDTNGGEHSNWTEADRERLSRVIGGLQHVKTLNMQLSQEQSQLIGPGNSKPFAEPELRSATSHNDSWAEMQPQLAAPERGIEKILQQGGPQLSQMLYQGVRLSPTVLNALSYCPNLHSLSVDLEVDLLRTSDESMLPETFQRLTRLEYLRINIVCTEANVYRTLRTLAVVLNTVAESARNLQILKLIRLPDPMSVDKQLATEFSAAFVKLNDETRLHDLHVCVLSSPQLFHIWSLPWPAFTRLVSLTLTDVDQNSERLRSLDVEVMPMLTNMTLSSDSLDDHMIRNVFVQQHPVLKTLTLRPGPKGLGGRALQTIGVACVGLTKLTVCYSRSEQSLRTERPTGTDWRTFFHRTSPVLETVVLHRAERDYVPEVVLPAASGHRVRVHAVDQPAYFDTFAEDELQRVR